MRRFGRGAPVVPPEVLARAGLGRGEKVLALCRADDGSWLLGTRDALVILSPSKPAEARIPWQQVSSADWSRDDDRLRVVEVGQYGRPQPVHVFSLDDPGSLLPFVRERVTASVVLQRRVEVRDEQGLMVIARRPPSGAAGVTWAYELDAGLDPADPEVQSAAEAGLRAAAEEIGLV